MALFSKQQIFCNCCGLEMNTEYSNVMGGKFLGYKVCSIKCVREIRWRETLSTMGKEYYPNPQVYEDEIIHKRDKVIRHTPYCSCGNKGTYYHRYDSYACVAGDIWLEDAEIPIDGHRLFDLRPEKPSEG